MNRIFKSILFLILFILIYPSSLFGHMIDLGQAKIISQGERGSQVSEIWIINQDELNKK